MSIEGKRVLCTMPGRHGDIFWALATCRSIAKATGEPVSLLVSEKYKGALTVAEKQEYIAYAGYLPAWEVQETAPITPHAPPITSPEMFKACVPGWDKLGRVVDLGYQRWPQEPSLPEEIFWSAEVQLQVKLPELELHEPWIKPAVEPWAGKPDGLRVCWTDEWAELKMGVLAALLHASGPGIPEQVDLLCRPGARVATEWSLPGCGATESGFDDASAALCEAEVVLACNSALWVLAAGLGRPVVLMEPNPQRHHPVFLPQEWAHCLVRGADGQPTFDARAVVAAVREAVARPLLWGAVMRGSA